VDTLEHIRDTEYDKSIYSCDYRDMTALREITDDHDLTMLLIHHTRKMSDPDPLNTLSGSTGLIGAVDGVFVLEKDKRTGNEAKLTIANRDTEGFCFQLEFDPDKCRWSFAGTESDLAEDKDEWLCLLIDDFLSDTWSGTATELCGELSKKDDEFGLTPRSISVQLKNIEARLIKSNIAFNMERKSDGRLITLTRRLE
jgi:hypothetical protein